MSANLTDMNVQQPNKDGPRWADCPLEPRVRGLESDMAVAKRDISSLEEDVKPLSAMISVVSSLKTYMKVSWALMSGVIVILVARSIINLIMGGTL